MLRRRYLTFVLVSLLSWLVSMGCSAMAPLALSRVPAGSAVTITVSAAASLQDALDAVAPQFTATHPDISVEYNFGSSGALQRQIEQGAPVDVFFSAATQQMDTLSEKHLVAAESRQNVIANALAVIAPVNSPLEVTTISQLKTLGISRFAVGEFRSVPAGQYAQQAFQKLGMLELLQPKFVFGNNVRGVLAAVESGNVELGIVYATDAVLSDHVKVLTTVPPELHQPIVYPAAIVASSAQLEAAQTFIDFLTTDLAQGIFQDFGFDSV